MTNQLKTMTTDQGKRCKLKNKSKRCVSVTEHVPVYNRICFEIIINISSSPRDVLWDGKCKEGWNGM